MVAALAGKAVNAWKAGKARNPYHFQGSIQYGWNLIPCPHNHFMLLYLRVESSRFSSIAKVNPRKIVLPISGAKYQSKIAKYVTKIRKQAQNFLHLGKFIPTKPNFCPTRSRKFIPLKLSTFTVLSVSENIGLPAWNVHKIHLLVTHLLSYVNGDNRYLTNDAILITIFE